MKRLGTWGIWAVLLAFGVLLAGASHADPIKWTGNGTSGTDPFGNDWLLIDDVIGMPGNGMGTVEFEGSWVTDFHFGTADATIVETLAGLSSDLTTFAHSDGDGLIVWDRVFNFEKNIVSFYAPEGTRLDGGELFFWNVVLDQPLESIRFTAKWTMVPEPGTALLFGGGMLGLGWVGRRRH